MAKMYYDNDADLITARKDGGSSWGMGARPRTFEFEGKRH